MESLDCIGRALRLAAEVSEERLQQTAEMIEWMFPEEMAEFMRHRRGHWIFQLPKP